MPVMKSKDGNNVYLDCNCSCGEGLRIRIEQYDKNWYAFLSYTNGNFYRDQNETMWRVFCKKMKKIWSIIRNKDYHYSDIVMTKDEFNEFREYINAIEYKEGEINEM